MSYFNLEIIANSKTIQMSEEQITSVEVVLDTPDDKVTGKSADILAHITIVGNIDPSKSKLYIELFNWAKDFTFESQYRKVKIAIGESNDKFCRSYEFERMFVVDYKEQYEKAKDGGQVGTFTLLINQEANNLQKAETFDK